MTETCHTCIKYKCRETITLYTQTPVIGPVVVLFLFCHSGSDNPNIFVYFPLFATDLPGKIKTKGAQCLNFSFLFQPPTFSVCQEVFKKPDTGGSLAIQLTYKITVNVYVWQGRYTSHHMLCHTLCSVQDAHLHLLYICGSCSNHGIVMFRSREHINIQNIVPLEILPLS